MFMVFIFFVRAFSYIFAYYSFLHSIFNFYAALQKKHLIHLCLRKTKHIWKTDLILAKGVTTILKIAVLLSTPFSTLY